MLLLFEFIFFFKGQNIFFLMQLLICKVSFNEQRVILCIPSQSDYLFIICLTFHGCYSNFFIFVLLFSEDSEIFIKKFQEPIV
jgi:hypothetical protein